MSFQENLKYYREKSGYKTAKDFADVLNIPYTSYVAYENKGREPKYEMLCKIADLLEVSTDDLLGRTSNILGNNEDDKLLKFIKTNLEPTKNFPNCIKELDLTFKELTDNSLVFNGGMFYPLIDFEISRKEIIQKINSINDNSEDFKKLEFQIYMYNALYKKTVDIFEERQTEIISKSNLSNDEQEELAMIKKNLLMLKSCNLTLERVLFFWSSDFKDK